MTIARISGVLLLAAFAALAPARAADSDPRWEEILGPSRGEVPPPAPGKLEWLPDMKKALEAAGRENRPIFVTLRCLPCEQCADFDKDVLDGGEVLTPLLKRFVCVRLLVWFRQHHNPGDEVTFTVLDDRGEKKTLKYQVGRTW